MAEHRYYGRTITRAEAVQRVALAAFPKANERAARKRVRSRIDYAIRTGSLAATAKGRILLERDFYAWAAAKWPALRAELPVPQSIAVPSAHHSVTAHAPGIFVIPTDPAKLRQAYMEAEAARQRLNRENEALRGECEEWRRKDERRRARGKAAGARGKGVKRPR